MSTARPEVTAFFKSLHEVVFRPRGYTKLRRIFQRDMGEYVVAFQFQGSDWNSASSLWCLYVNAGIQFARIPRREPDRDFPAIHSSMRVSAKLSSWAEREYHIGEEKDELLIARIAGLVEDCQRDFSFHHSSLRQAYELRPVMYLGYLDERLMR